MMPPFLKAINLEYRFRYLIHGAIYTLGLAAPWHKPIWGFLENGSLWFLASNSLAKPTYQAFAMDWNVILIGIVLFALAGAALRTWGAAYLGASTVHRQGLEGDRIVASGPYRFTRNPLYVGTILNTVAVCMLMRPEAAALTLVLIVIIQFRLIGREEPYLLQTRGSAYRSYLEEVPRLLPSLRPHGPGNFARPNWTQGILSEVYVIGCAFSFALLGWTSGFSWEITILRVLQGIVVSLGLSVLALAFIKQGKA